jgi:hypothetical protein
VTADMIGSMVGTLVWRANYARHMPDLPVTRIATGLIVTVMLAIAGCGGDPPDADRPFGEVSEGDQSRLKRISELSERLGESSALFIATVSENRLKPARGAIDSLFEAVDGVRSQIQTIENVRLRERLSNYFDAFEELCGCRRPNAQVLREPGRCGRERRSAAPEGFRNGGARVTAAGSRFHTDVARRGTGGPARRDSRARARVRGAVAGQRERRALRWASPSPASGFKPAVAASAERDKVRRVIDAALCAGEDVVRGDIVRGAAFAARSVALHNQSRELPPGGLLVRAGPPARRAS